MACNCGSNNTRVSLAGTSNVPVNSRFDAAKKNAQATQRTKKFCPGCGTYGVKIAAVVVKCPLCGTTFSAR